MLSHHNFQHTHLWTSFFLVSVGCKKEASESVQVRLIFPHLATLLLAPGWALLWLSSCTWQAICSSVNLFEQRWHHGAFLLKLILKIAANQKTKVDRVPNLHIYPTENDGTAPRCRSQPHCCFSILPNWELLSNCFCLALLQIQFYTSFFLSHQWLHFIPFHFIHYLYLTWKKEDNLTIFIIKIHKTFQ